MEHLLEYEKKVQSFLCEDVPPGAGVLPFPNDLESGCPEAELWSRVHLSYVKSGGYSNTAAIDQWADTHTTSLMEYVPKKTWLLSQTELKELKQKLILGMQNNRYELSFQLSDTDDVITPLTLFCQAYICSTCKVKESFDDKLLPADVSWPQFLSTHYAPIWRTAIEFVCTKVTDENLLPTALHVLAEVSKMNEHFIKLSANQCIQEECLSWLYESQQLKTISSCCEDAISLYFDNTCKLHLCDDLDQMLSTEGMPSVTQQVNNCVHGGKVVVQSCWRLCNDVDRMVLILNGRCPLTEWLQPLCAHVIDRAISACFQKLSEWCSTDAPLKLPYISWYIVLSSLLHMAGRLQHHVMHNAAYCLANTLQECSKLVDKMQSDIVNYHVELCRNGLLHDGRSHHWQDSRPFYEGERCSFSIQMWAYHLNAFKHDLWQVFASDVASKLLGAVLAEGLVILSQRYNSVKPSMRRLPQMKGDILLVLLTSASLLPHIFPYCCCLHSHQLYVTSCVINSCCMSLLRDLTIVCADLRMVMDLVMENTMATNGLRRGFNDFNSQWLGHILLRCRVDLPVTYMVGLSSGVADAANDLLHLCSLSTLNEQLLIKVLVANDFLFSKGLIMGGAGVLSELAHVLFQCSHAPNGLCIVLEQAGNKECIDWLTCYLRPHLLWCILPRAVLFTRWMAKFLHNKATVADNDSNTLMEIFSGTLKHINDLLLLLPSPVCLLISRLSPVSTLLGRLLHSMFPQPHNQLFHNFVSIMTGLLDGSMLFEVPASIVDVLNLCKADLVPTVAALNDPSLVTTGIYTDTLSDDSEHMIVAKLLKETCKGRRSLNVLYSMIVSNQDALLQWCKEGGVAGQLLPLTVPPTSTGAKLFCPTKEFCKIGQVTLDHTALLKASLDWQDLLSAVSPQLSQETLVNRLGNRWEFQKEAWLNDEESHLVDAIKKKLKTV